MCASTHYPIHASGVFVGRTLTTRRGYTATWVRTPAGGQGRTDALSVNSLGWWDCLSANSKWEAALVYMRIHTVFEGIIHEVSQPPPLAGLMVGLRSVAIQKHLRVTTRICNSRLCMVCVLAHAKKKNVRFVFWWWEGTTWKLHFPMSVAGLYPGVAKNSYGVYIFMSVRCMSFGYVKKKCSGLCSTSLSGLCSGNGNKRQASFLVYTQSVVWRCEEKWVVSMYHAYIKCMFCLIQSKKV